jgi:hypothetical protein
VCVALVIQHAKRMRHIILSSVSYLGLHIFTHYIVNGMIFGGKNVIERKLRFSIFSTTFYLNHFSL